MNCSHTVFLAMMAIMKGQKAVQQIEWGGEEKENWWKQAAKSGTSFKLIICSGCSQQQEV